MAEQDGFTWQTGCSCLRCRGTIHLLRMNTATDKTGDTQYSQTKHQDSDTVQQHGCQHKTSSIGGKACRNRDLLTMRIAVKKSKKCDQQQIHPGGKANFADNQNTHHHTRQ